MSKQAKARQLRVASEKYVGSAAMDVIVKGIMEEIQGVRTIANNALNIANNALPKTGGVISGNLGVSGNVVATGEGTFHNTTASISDTIRAISYSNDDIDSKINDLETVANTLMEEVKRLKAIKEEQNKEIIK